MRNKTVDPFNTSGKCCCCGSFFFCFTHLSLSPRFVSACIADPGVLAKNVTEEELCYHLTFIKEEAFILCDKITRDTGRLTKLVVVFDMKNVSMGIPAKSIQNGMNKSSEIAQVDLYI